MPKALTDTQRRASRLQTLDRPQANHLLNTRGLPFVHAGKERYLTLVDAIVQLGVDDTLDLARDKRSLLYWRGADICAISGLTCAAVLGRAIMTPEEAREIQALRYAGEYDRLPVTPDSSPLYRQLQAVAQDVRVLSDRQDAGEDPRAVWKLDPEVLGRLLRLLGEMQAPYVLLVHPHDPEDVTLARLRRNIADYILTPHETSTRMLHIIMDAIRASVEPDRDTPLASPTP